MPDDEAQIPTLYNLAIEVVLRKCITENTENLNPYTLPDRIVHDLIREVSSFYKDMNPFYAEQVSQGVLLYW